MNNLNTDKCDRCEKEWTKNVVRTWQVFDRQEDMPLVQIFNMSSDISWFLCDDCYAKEFETGGENL